MPMAETKITRIVLRHDSSTNWNEVGDTVVLLKGEVGVEYPNEGGSPKLKIGDGLTPWATLGYLSLGGNSSVDDSAIQTLLNLVNTFDTRITNAEGSAAQAIVVSEETAKKLEEIGVITAQSIEAMRADLDNNIRMVEQTVLDIDNLQSEQTVLTTKVDNTDVRMDNFLANLTDAESLDGGELIDIRAGYDGKFYPSAGAAVRQIGYDLNELSDNLEGALGKDIADGLLYEGNQLYLTANGEIISEPVTIVGGSGGGGGSSNQTYAITLMNLLDSRVITITEEEECILEFSYHSIDEDGFGDGPGIGYISTNAGQVTTIVVQQGSNTFNITPYLKSGDNNIKIQVENSEGSRKTLTYTVAVMVLSVTSTVPKMALYTGRVSLPYTVTGSGTKTVRFLMDGRQIAEETVATSGVSRIITLPENIADGAHILQIYAEVPNGLTEVIKSNVLEIGMLYYSSTMTTQAILLMNYEGPEKVEQGATLTFPYMVYDPALQTTDIRLNIYNEDGILYGNSIELSVNQQPQEWITQNYPAGKVKFEIVCKDTSSSQIIEVTPTTFDKQIITDGCVLNFEAKGRSNNENNPEQWEYNGITAKFSGFGWANVDGWVNNGGQTVLRFLPGNFMEINFKPFDTDLRVNGYTIEAEFETHNVQDYDSIIASAIDDGCGFVIKSQAAQLSSVQATVSAQFKEDSRVRVTFVVEPTSLNKFIYIYINGVMSKVIQYLEDDNFTQNKPVNISIGAESCGLDLYSLRIYNRGFTRYEQLNNFICDRSALSERIEANERNDILDETNSVTINTLPKTIPYIILECEELPQFKGDKKKDKSVTFIDPMKPNRNFTASGVQLDVQGTSSAGYPIKNYKVSLKKGLTYTASGNSAEGFPILEGGLEGSTICLKADFASSEQANNVMLVDYYEQLSPYKNPAQIADERVRTAVRGFPCVVFWKNTKNSTITFIGKYNFNDDKSNENVFGFNRDIYPKCECWEFLNNDSTRVLFQESEYEKEVTITNPDGSIETYPAWWDDFEARFPDLDDPYRDYTQFKRMTDWVVSTNRELVDTDEEKAMRLQKFKNEFEQYFIKDAMLFYYLFTEVFVLADSRAKNLFLTTFDGTHWFPIPYDMDTAIGIDNTGNLIFEYDVEDTDIVNGATVFSGQASILWKNVRDAFGVELKTMYSNLRSDASKPFNYTEIRDKMKKHQSIWPEALWNEDQTIKYINATLAGERDEEGNIISHLPKLQGSKESQRDWWLYNGFKYRDSKYQTGDATKNYIFLRLFAPGNIFVTPYSHIWPAAKYGGNSAVVTLKGKKNETYELINPVSQPNNLETWIYSADRISKIGDLSGFKIGDAQFQAATKLQEIILGSDAEGYENPNLFNLSVGTNELLTLINVQNCTNPAFQAIDLSECHGLETILANGSALTGLTLPNGGHLKTLKLPASFTTLTIRNQKNIEELTLESQENLRFLRIEDSPNLPMETLINNSPKLERARLINVEWEATDEASLQITMDKLFNCKGFNADGLNIDNAIVTGRVHVKQISETFLEKINDIFPELVVVVDGVAKYFIRYADWDNKLLYRYIATEGTAAIDPIEAGYISIPTRPNTEDAKYEYKNWSELPEKITRPYSIIAKYKGVYRVRFYDLENNLVGNEEQWVTEGESAIDPVKNGAAPPKKPSSDQYDYFFSGWDKDFTNIDGTNLVFYPVFREELRSYLVTFLNDEEILQESKVFYGDTAIFTGDTESIKKKIGGEPSPYYEFIGWDRDPAEPIIGITYFYAQFAFDGYIEDSWEEIAANCKAGNIDKYGLGGRKQITYTLAGKQSTVEMEIIGKNHDDLANIDSEYNKGSSTASLSFLGIILGQESWYMSQSATDEWNKNEEVFPFPDSSSSSQWPAGFNWGGWEFTNTRKKLQGELFSSLPAELQNNIKPVIKLCDFGRYYGGEVNKVTDTLWIPSATELNSEKNAVATSGLGRPYPIFNLASSRIKYAMNGNKTSYWTRSSDKSSSHNYRYTDTQGEINSLNAANSLNIAFGFCL